MTKRTWVKIDKKGREEEWSWEETSETKKALAEWRAVAAKRIFIDW